MQADYAVELGPHDEVLEFPWSAHEQGLEYYDLKRHPELLKNVSEAERVSELAPFLTAINSPELIVETVKCDVWSSTDINPEEEIFGAAVKFGSYVDLVFSHETSRFSFPDHEDLAKSLSECLSLSADIPAAAELLIRRCYYHFMDRNAGIDQREAQPGFYITFYLFGYGANEELARQQWVEGLKLAQRVLLRTLPRFTGKQSPLP